MNLTEREIAHILHALEQSDYYMLSQEEHTKLIKKLKYSFMKRVEKCNL